jgi:hypothetical protein
MAQYLELNEMEQMLLIQFQRGSFLDFGLARVFQLVKEDNQIMARPWSHHKHQIGICLRQRVALLARTSSK